MRADLHCHSDFSDGMLAPAAVVARARARGVELLALTDHDELGGLVAAAKAASGSSLRLINGVEVSACWEAHAIHIVGLDVRTDEPTLLAGLTRQRAGRLERAERMAAELARIGIRDALAGARRFAANPELIGRAHFARYLVASGLVRDVPTVFTHYLKPGKPGYVPHNWVGVSEAVAWIRAAGGIPVLAHPGRYRLGSRELERLVGVFCDAGGQGIEVVSGADGGKALPAVAALVRRRQLLASRGSDFHSAEQCPCDLGDGAPLPPDLEPVWSRLPKALASASS